MKRKAATAVVLAAFTWQAPVLGEVKLAEQDGWKVSTDGRVNAFLSIARGTGIPDGQPEIPGATTKDTKDSNDELRSTRIRNGFLASILGFTLEKQAFKNLKVTTRAALWLNATSSRTKNSPGAVDPRELYAKLEGPWGSVLGGSALALFGRGGILVDSEIAHDYGMGYPCLIENASGGACGMAAFGAIFPSFESGIVYTTPPLAGFELSVGIYDPATVANAQLTRAPLPRVEGELSYSAGEVVKVFANGFWQKLEGSPTEMGVRKDLNATGWGGQGGFMLRVGPILAGGAGFMGQGISPITYLEENQISFNAQGVPRKSRGAFGLAAVKFDAIRLKLAGGAGVFRLDKLPTDADPVSPTGLEGNPQMIKQNFGVTVGAYQTTGPVRFALEYFRAEHGLYEFGQTNPNLPGAITIKKPVQVVNFINAGFTVVW